MSSPLRFLITERLLDFVSRRRRSGRGETEERSNGSEMQKVSAGSGYEAVSDIKICLVALLMAGAEDKRFLLER